MSKHKRDGNLVGVKSLVLPCLMEKQANGIWFSICLDLNLHAHGETPELAKKNLHEIVRQYVHEALTEDSDYIGDMIPRRAPVYFWVRYYWARLLRWYSPTTIGNQSKNFEDHLPLIPAV